METTLPLAPETLTIESLARAIHEDERAAYLKVLLRMYRNDGQLVLKDFDKLQPEWRAFRLEQARLMFDRIMR
jgi:hypothetical protein